MIASVAPRVWASAEPGTFLHRLAERTERFSGLRSWLGHPLHPLATDAVIGSWSLAAIPDLRRGDNSDAAVKSLVGFGVLAAIPTAASGVSDWADTPDPRVRRIGLVHAASNVALVLHAGSYVVRRGARRTLGARLTAASALPLTIGGFLGAHMAYARGVGVSRTAFDERIPDWMADRRAYARSARAAPAGESWHCAG